MYKCLECGNIFDEGEQKEWTEPNGERLDGCPLCHGDYREATYCAECEEIYTNDELCGGICEKCINSHRYDMDLCLEIGEKSKYGVEINSFLWCVFSPEEIEEVLINELNKTRDIVPIDCNYFINADREWFAERVAEYEKNIRL